MTDMHLDTSYAFWAFADLSFLEFKGPQMEGPKLLGGTGRNEVPSQEQGES